MAELEGFIDLASLEQEIKGAIESDRIYWQQNEAKIRAVTDRKVKDYEEFRERVNAAHLKPLEKTDKLAEHGFKTIWNPTSRRKDDNEYQKMADAEQFCEDLEIEIRDRVFGARLPSPFERYSYLKNAGAEKLSLGLRREVPVGVLGDIIEALSAFPNTTDDVLFVVSVLDALTKAERFRLSLDFLTCSEKDLLWSLLDRLAKSFNNRHQDLAEQGVTEWTLEALRNKYSVTGKKPQE